MLHAPPQPLDEHVVHVGARGVHTDLDTTVQQHRGERLGGELTTLVGVEYPGLSDEGRIKILGGTAAKRLGIEG